MKNKMNLAGIVRAFLSLGDYRQTDEGLIVHDGIRVRGRYVDRVNGKDERETYNLIVGEGVMYILEAALGTNTTLATLYLAPYGNNVAPASTWTAANWDSFASEIDSGTNGYSESVRQTWAAGAATSIAGGAKIGNLASRAAHSIVTTGSPLSIYGAALLSSNVKGGSAGTLISAVQFPAARIVNNSDVWELGYEVELTDS